MVVVVAAAIIIVALSVIAKNAMQDIERKREKQAGVSIILSKIDAAIVNFVAQNKYLPCPALGTTANGALNAGVEQRTGVACNPASQITGVVPWVTLGIPERDAADGWSQRITYRVDPALANNVTRLMDMSNCSLIGTGLVNPMTNGCVVPAMSCASNPAGCTSLANFLTNKGLDVWDGVVPYAARVNNRANGSGAAYVLISHGANGIGAYNSNGTLQPGTGTVGNNEIPNQNNQALAAFPPGQAQTFRDAQFDNSVTAQHYDDQVSHPMILNVLKKAYLAARQ